MGQLIYLKDVVTLQLDQEKCTGCGTCLEVCPRQVFSLNGKQVRIANRDACMECGACALNCPFDALSVEAGVGCAAAVIEFRPGTHRRLLLLCHRTEEGRAAIRNGSPKNLLLLNPRR